MNTKWMIVVLSFAGLVTPALGQGVSEATGTVNDRAGSPVQGAVVTFYANSNPDVPYSGKTNKKGRYFVSGMFTGKEGDMWRMECNAEGLVPVEVRVESRTVNKVLVGDVMTVKLRPGKSIPEIPIPPLGKATVDWTLAPQEDVEAELKAAAEAAQAAAVAEGSVAAQPAKDPWVEALTLAADGALDESVTFFQEAVDDEPDNAERHETFAKILYQLERVDEAEAEAQRAVAIDGGRVQSHLVLFNIYEQRGDLEQARATLEAARESSPENTQVLLRLAHVAAESGDNDGAVAVYEQVTQLAPDNAEAWLALADLYSTAGRLEKSEAAYSKVVEIDPDGAHQTYYNLGATIVKRGNVSEADRRRAVEAFRKALEIKPDYARAANELAIALIGLGEMKEARQALESFVEGNPDSPDATRMKALIQTLPR